MAPPLRVMQAVYVIFAIEILYKFASHLLVKLDISIDFCVQRFIAEMIAVLKPFSSSVTTASIVVPLGEQTISFNTPGCIPVSSTIFAEPNTA